jgi:hypothetical protein
VSNPDRAESRWATVLAVVAFALLMGSFVVADWLFNAKR